MTACDRRSTETLSTLLSASARAAADGDLRTALRTIDRAYRRYPDERHRIVRPYAQSLYADGQDDAATLAMLQRVSSGITDEACEAMILDILLRQHDVSGARRRLAQALARLAVQIDGPLWAAARRVLSADVDSSTGVIALTADFTLLGLSISGRRWSVIVDGQRLTVPPPDAEGCWQIALPRPSLMAHIEATLDGRPVWGIETQRSAHAGLSVQSDPGAHTLRLRVQCEWDPHFAPKLHVRAARRRVLTPTTREVDGLVVSEFLLRRHDDAADRPWHLALSLPDGSTWTLPDSPFLWPMAARADLPPARSRPPRRVPPRAPCAIVIPVYADLEATRACLESVLATRPPDVRVIVVDDATPEPAIAQLVDEWTAQGAIERYRHARNRGFVAAVNTGMARCDHHDVILLNADTVVFGNWVERLQATAYAHERTGTVTPWSGDGTIVSYPARRAQERATAGAQLDALAAALLEGQSAELPVGVGFCLYLRHDCRAAVGPFSEAVFGHGYGEETDFCLRAADAGYRSVLAASVYVEHRGGGSFGSRRAALLNRAQRLIGLRHPRFHRRVARFLAKDPLQVYRRRLDEARLRNHGGPFVLLVSLALGGGVGRFVEARQTQWLQAGMTPLVLMPDGLENPQHARLRSSGIDCEDLRYHGRTDREALRTLLRALPLDHIEINHVLDLPFDLVDELYELGVPVDVQLHDYVYLCPQVTLMGPEGRYCGEQGLSQCRRCVKVQGSAVGAGMAASALRRRSQPWLRKARSIRAPSDDTAERYRRYFVDLPIEVVPHGHDLIPPPTLIARTRRPRVRVALLGGIGDHKGYRVLRDCVDYATRQDLPLEFVVIGYTHDDAALLISDRVFITGPYAEPELIPLLQREAPDVIFLSSVWPETWSYTLDAALSTDLPIVAFDLGAIARRVSQSGRGNLLPLASPTAAVCAALMAPRPSDSVLAESQSLGVPRMADADPNALSSNVQVLPLPAGVYLFSVQGGSSAGTTPAGALTLPALHIGVGPGVASQDVEFMGRPGSSEGWLIRNGDFLVLRLHAAQTPVLVTSLQDGGGNALTVRAERLDARFEDAVAASVENGVTESAVGLPLEIAAHVRNRGDMTFTRSAWAGRIDKGLWIESFSIQPLDGLTAAEIEYKSLTSSGFETPWISDAKLCGTQGMGVPLIGFAVRLKPGARASAYEVEYTGAFASGALVGPLKNGVPCRSTVANDPLEGLQVRVVLRAQGSRSKASSAPSPIRAASPAPSIVKKKPASTAKAKAKAKGSAKSNAQAKAKTASQKKAPTKRPTNPAAKAPPKSAVKPPRPAKTTPTSAKTAAVSAKSGTGGTSTARSALTALRRTR